MGTRLRPDEIRSRLKSNPNSANPSTSGFNLLVAAPGVGLKIMVYGFMVMNNAPTAQSFYLASAANQKTGLFVLPAAGTVPNIPIYLPPTVMPLVECNENEALQLLLSSGTSVMSMVWYTLEKVPAS